MLGSLALSIRYATGGVLLCSELKLRRIGVVDTNEERVSFAL